MDTKQVVNDIIAKLRVYSEHYYNTSEPLVSDEEYDSLVNDLHRLSPGNPFFKEVGAPPAGGYKVTRTIPMGTLSKIYKKEDLNKFIEVHPGETLLLSPKYDGFAVELNYDRNGKLISAGTRGDGYEGESILDAMSKIVPTNVSELAGVTVRGEAIIPKRYRSELESLGYKALRNAVPGIIRSASSEALKYVHFIAYEFFTPKFERDVPITVDGVETSTIVQYDLTRREQREMYGRYFTCEASHEFPAGDVDEIQKSYESFYSRREDYPYEVDGMVVKTDTVNYDDIFLHPTQMIAYKFKSNREITTLRDIEYQLGATGKFTPIGVFDPVEFQGATLTRASLGSMMRLASFEFKPSVGSTIEVSRRGDIIPYIEEISTTVEGKEFGPLEYCPYCFNELLIDGEGNPTCINKSCPEILRLKVTQYVTSLKVKGLGSALIQALLSTGKIKSIADLYRINPEVIGTIPGYGTSTVEKFKEFQTKQVSPLQFLCAYPFENLGESVWKEVLKRYEISNLVFESRIPQDFEGMKGVGPGKINSIVEQLRSNQVELRDILAISTVVAPTNPTVQ